MKKETLTTLAPGQEMIMDLISKDGVKVVRDSIGQPTSVSPCEVGFGYLYHSHMIPPYKPDNMLLLGYGMGTVPELIRKVHGDVKITGVDHKVADRFVVEDKMITGDAFEFVKECSESLIKRRYDYVAVDLFEDGEVPEFVFRKDFSVMISKITKKLLCLNTKVDDFGKLKNYSDYGFKFHRHVQTFGNIISWWQN